MGRNNPQQQEQQQAQQPQAQQPQYQQPQPQQPQYQQPQYQQPQYQQPQHTGTISPQATGAYPPQAPQPAYAHDQQYPQQSYEMADQQPPEAINSVPQAPPPSYSPGPQSYELNKAPVQPQYAEPAPANGTPQAAYATQSPQQSYTAQQAQPAVQAPAGAGLVNAVPLSTLNRGPAPVDCPVCGQRAMTNIEYISGGFTHLLAFGLCICLCLGCIPYCLNDTKDVQHKCSSCGAMLATWHRSGGVAEVHVHG